MRLSDDRTRRAFARNAQVNGQIPGRLVGAESAKTLEAVVVDISRVGMGVVTKTPLAAGDSLWLLIKDRAVKLTVRHCAATDGAWRLGLESTLPLENLEEHFVSSGAARPRALEY
jgi:hypothetical protein